MPDRATIVRDLVQAGRTGGEVVAAARGLGFTGRALRDLTEAELLALYYAVWPEQRPHEPARVAAPVADSSDWTPDDSPEGRALNAHLDALRF